ncbi:MATE family efflux transporter [Peptoniphilus sp. KCTC 25270]|uniref:MATE family efflux transporter n=1 Tax=Peptoniphilus sp. KCTC 25270 TaxID=2897414 RepID=UPI001E3F0A9C|nr:MATE family efflux transporter [Peptoniphilus sp. KCTC 25270]MCD1147497.1 MATE family efflux transporter [Peptoniphilus sp. KCTC 25270]
MENIKTEIKLSDSFTYGRLLRFALPSIIMVIFTSIYGVIDGLFVSNFIGETSFAALNFIMPFIMILGGIGFMIGTGGSALVASELGRGNQEKANEYFGMLIVFTLCLGAIVSIVGMALIPQIVDWLGGTEKIASDAIIYGRVTIFFMVPFMLQGVFQSFFVAAEKPKLGLWMTVASGITNVILDFVFIVVFKMGIAGAALATGVGECVGGLLPVLYFLRPNSSLLQLKKTKMDWKAIWQTLVNGSSELMNSVSASVVGMVFNYQLLRYIGEGGVSAYGVLMYLQFIFVSISLGFSFGTAPVISFHYGANHIEELQSLLKKSLILMLGIGIFLAVFAFLMAEPFSDIFVGYSPELLAMTTRAFRIFSFAFVLFGVNIYISSFFTALNNGRVSAIIAFLRTLVFKMGAVLILPVLFGVEGIWWATGASEIFAFVVSVGFLFLLRKYYRYF